MQNKILIYVGYIKNLLQQERQQFVLDRELGYEDPELHWFLTFKIVPIRFRYLYVQFCISYN